MPRGSFLISAARSGPAPSRRPRSPPRAEEAPLEETRPSPGRPSSGDGESDTMSPPIEPSRRRLGGGRRDGAHQTGQHSSGASRPPAAGRVCFANDPSCTKILFPPSCSRSRISFAREGCGPKINLRRGSRLERQVTPARRQICRRRAASQGVCRKGTGCLE